MQWEMPSRAMQWEMPRTTRTDRMDARTIYMSRCFFFCTNVLRIHYILFSCTRKRKHEQLTAFYCCVSRGPLSVVSLQRLGDFSPFQFCYVSTVEVVKQFSFLPTTIIGIPVENNYLQIHKMPIILNIWIYFPSRM